MICITDSYHHGNLRSELIEEGLALIHEEGRGVFSLRKLAKKVGVSPTACYNHFSGVEELISEMKSYVSERFSAALRQGAFEQGESDATIGMGVAYVNFFAENPYYFSFIFDNDEYSIDLSESGFSGNFEPFEVFRSVTTSYLIAHGIPDERINDNLVVMWATVHGLAAMANMKGVHYDGDWKALTRKTLIEKLKIC